MSIYLKYDSVPIILSRSFELPSSRNQAGNLKVLDFPNQWGSSTTSFATSGFISLAATSGIYLNCPNFVELSGLRANAIVAQKFNRIGPTGESLDFYSGTNNALTYKASANELGTINNFIYSTGINKLISTDGSPGSPLFVHPSTGLDESNPTREITTFSKIKLKPEVIINEGGASSIVPAKVSISGANFVTENIQIGYFGNSYKNTILTHQGENVPAAWVKADYLKADGALWNRYPKRAVRVENNRIIFYGTRPVWALINDVNDYAVFDLNVLLDEFGPGDTMAIIDAATLNVFYVKPAVSVSFSAVDPDPSTTFTDYIKPITFTEVLTSGANATTLQGFAMEVCPGTNLPNEGQFVHAYAFSVKKGAYLTMQLEPDATNEFTCGNDPTNLKFKPSTLNTISIRPNVHTSFNTLAENIDFIIYGHTPVSLDAYDPALFGLDESNVPSGLVPGFKVDANIPNAVVGDIGSGIIYSSYLDRARTIPTGYIVDNTSKICINRNSAHIISSITSGVGYLSNYASVSISGVTYTDQLLTQDIYLTPKPNADGTGKYIANALLTLNSAGQIVSKRPTTNPVIPSAPSGLTIAINGNNECSLRWLAGPDGGSAINNYIIEFSANGGNTWTTVPSGQILRGNNSQTSCTITDLQTSVSYYFRIKAQNGVGIGTSATSGVAYTANYNVSQSPNNFSALRTYGDELSIIDLSWSSPDSVGSSAISGYMIEESENNGISWIYHNTINSLISGTAETIYGLSNGTNYLYRISAINASGQGTYNYVYSSGNVIPVTEETNQEDTLSNWDFGVVLFTGVC